MLTPFIWLWNQHLPYVKKTLFVICFITQRWHCFLNVRFWHKADERRADVRCERKADIEVVLSIDEGITPVAGY
jgi:hypothetical protein